MIGPPGAVFLLLEDCGFPVVFAKYRPIEPRIMIILLKDDARWRAGPQVCHQIARMPQVLRVRAGISQRGHVRLNAWIVVQLAAPPEQRGRVIGLYGMSANGLRFGSGITVGLLGGLIGVHASLGLSSAALCVSAPLVAVYARSRRIRPAQGEVTVIALGSPKDASRFAE